MTTRRLRSSTLVAGGVLGALFAFGGGPALESSFGVFVAAAPVGVAVSAGEGLGELQHCGHRGRAGGPFTDTNAGAMTRERSAMFYVRKPL